MNSFSLRSFFRSAIIPLVTTILLSSIFIFFEGQKEEVQELEMRAYKLGKKWNSLLSKKEKEKQLLTTLEKASPFFLNEKVPPFPLLEKESKKVSFLSSYMPHHPTLEERSLALKNNTLSFLEVRSQSNEIWSETELKQEYPVEVSVHDLKEILSLIEGEKGGGMRPLLTFKRFSLTKKRENTFSLNGEVIQKTPKKIEGHD